MKNAKAYEFESFRRGLPISCIGKVGATVNSWPGNSKIPRRTLRRESRRDQECRKTPCEFRESHANARFRGLVMARNALLQNLPGVLGKSKDFISIPSAPEVSHWRQTSRAHRWRKFCMVRISSPRRGKLSRRLGLLQRGRSRKLKPCAFLVPIHPPEAALVSMLAKYRGNSPQRFS